MFGQSGKDEKRDESFDRSITEMVEALAHKPALFRFLRNFVVLNTIIWLVSLFFYERVNRYYFQVFDSSNEAGIGILLVPFLLGAFITYALCRLKFPDIEDNKLQSEMMASYSYQAHSTKRWYVWLFSILGGVFNAVLIVLVNLYLNGRL